MYVGSNNELQVYGPTGTTPIRTIPATNVDTIAIDSANHVYADVCPAGKGSIEVFSPTGTLIRSNPGCAHFLALDRNDYLHAGYQGANINLGGNLVIYKPYSFRPFKVIRHGIDRIRAMIVDPKGNIYVANGRGGTNVGDVAMYHAGKGVPSWTLSRPARPVFQR